MRYLLFAGEYYYPCGGWEDFAGAFASLDEAKAAKSDPDYCQWAHIVDLDAREIVLTWAGSTEAFARQYKEQPSLPAGWFASAEIAEREAAFAAVRGAFHERVRKGV